MQKTPQDYYHHHQQHHHHTTTMNFQMLRTTLYETARLPLCSNARPPALLCYCAITHTHTHTDRRVWSLIPLPMRPSVTALAAQTHHREAVACCVNDLDDTSGPDEFYIWPHTLQRKRFNQFRMRLTDLLQPSIGGIP
jgi:hypothetical protein